MYQIKESSDEEMKEIYKKFKKKELIEMLIEANKQLNLVTSIPINYDFTLNCNHLFKHIGPYWKTCSRCNGVFPSTFQQ
ncbi:MAG TPA: hypothetical protein PKD00_03220 [Burkholderiales bacterium]|nr:hypothetical protein [Burkholderiales bacterium]